MKIALYISGMKYGGTERKVGNIANYLAADGYDVLMVNVRIEDGEYPLDSRIRRVICEPAKEELTSNRIHNFSLRFKKLRQIWIEEKPDVILSYIGKTNMMTILTSRGLKIPVAVGLAGTPTEEYYTPFLRICAKLLFAHADAVVLQTKQSESFFPRRVLKKSIIMKNPMAPEFDVDRYEGERDKTIVSVGRIDANKNHELVINAFSKVADAYPAYKLIIYGEGDLRESLIDKVNKMGMAERILLPGRTQNVADTIKKAGVFVLTSNTEGSPNALIEAMMLGLPVISTDCPCGGPAELITNGSNGLLISVGDEKMMQDCLQKLLGDLHFADQIGRAASETRAIYSPKIVMKRWEYFLETLANTGKVIK